LISLIRKPESLVLLGVVGRIARVYFQFDDLVLKSVWDFYSANTDWIVFN